MYDLYSFNLVFAWISLWGIDEIIDIYKFVYKCFSWTGSMPCFKRNSVEILVKFQVLEYFLRFRVHDRSGEFPFFKRARISNALRAFEWVSRNWDPLKGTRRLSRVDLSGSGRDRKPNYKIIYHKACPSLLCQNQLSFTSLTHKHDSLWMSISSI